MSKGKWKPKERKVSRGIERLLGLYEQQLVRLNLSRQLLNLDKNLHLFFELFPEKNDPEDFSSLDVEYFKSTRGIEYPSETKKTAEILKHTRAFFFFCIDYLEYNLPNPCSERSYSMWTKLRDEQRHQDTPHNILERNPELADEALRSLDT